VDIASVGFDESQLAITADIVVPGSAERMLQLLGDEPSHELVGPFTSTSANVRTTKARSMAYLLFPLVAGILGSNLTARQAYELIIPEIINAGMLTVCGSLVEFLTVALVCPMSERSTPLTVQHRLGKVKLRYGHRSYQPSPHSHALLQLAGTSPQAWGCHQQPGLD
jgi:hypothetical protein